MTFTLEIKVDTNDTTIKDECMKHLAKYLSRKGIRFGVGYNPNEVDIDKLGKA